MYVVISIASTEEYEQQSEKKYIAVLQKSFVIGNRRLPLLHAMDPSLNNDNVLCGVEIILLHRQAISIKRTFTLHNQ